MAGKITVSTINDSSGPLATQNGMTGIAKAWCNFDGYTSSTATIKGSYNISSVTRNAAGDYTLNFTTAMSNANYAYAGSAAYGENASGTSGRYVTAYDINYPFGLSTGSLRFLTVYAANSGSQDCQFVSIIVCGT
jgi:hypothetical protein